MSRAPSPVCSVMAIALLAGCGGSGENGAVDGEVELTAPGEDFLATLCFPTGLGLLRCEERPIPAEGSAEETAAVIIEALIAGPERAEAPDPVAGEPDDEDGDPTDATDPIDDVFPALPAGVRLLALEVLDNVAYVDLTMADVGDGRGDAAGRSALVLERPAMGLTEELLAVYSVVNSLTANSLGIDRVVLMWNGEQRPTFAGHVDTTRPLMADLERNAEPSGGV
ncbi:MAG: GerMN domain-containing protein [Acidobacteria bacterium]|nr:GerMN domain-containing protein [Acidobacteriota bacterium]